MVVKSPLHKRGFVQQKNQGPGLACLQGSRVAETYCFRFSFCNRFVQRPFLVLVVVSSRKPSWPFLLGSLLNGVLRSVAPKTPAIRPCGHPRPGVLRRCRSVIRGRASGGGDQKQLRAHHQKRKGKAIHRLPLPAPTAHRSKGDDGRLRRKRKATVCPFRNRKPKAPVNPGLPGHLPGKVRPIQHPRPGNGSFPGHH